MERNLKISQIYFAVHLKLLCSSLSLSHVQLFETPYFVACQAPMFMEFSREEYGVCCHTLLQGIFTT